MFSSHCTIPDSLEFVRRNAEIKAGRAGTDAPPPDEPDLPNLDLIYTPPQSPRQKRTKEEQHALDEHAMGLRAHGKTFRQIAAQLGITPSSAFNRVKRHLHRQREVFEEHVADVRDYDLLVLKIMEPMHVKKGREGDARSYALVMRAIELRHKLLKIRNPTAADELLKLTDLAQQLAKGFDDLLIEAEEHEIEENRAEEIGAEEIGAEENGAEENGAEEIEAEEHETEQNETEQNGVGPAEEGDHEKAGEQAAESARTEREQSANKCANKCANKSANKSRKPLRQRRLGPQNFFARNLPDRARNPRPSAKRLGARIWMRARPAFNQKSFTSQLPTLVMRVCSPARRSTVQMQGKARSLAMPCLINHEFGTTAAVFPRLPTICNGLARGLS